MTEPTDSSRELQKLIAGTAAGDRRAFERLYQRSSPQLYSLLLRMLGRRDWAEEALQDCYLRVWQKADRYAPDKGTQLTWLLSIARYRALDLLRQRRPEVSDTDEESVQADAADPAADVVAAAMAREGMGRLADCMKGLQVRQRDSVLLAYYEGYTHFELARRLQVPLGTVKSWVRRGMANLRRCMETSMDEGR